jgi:hypothetical protein
LDANVLGQVTDFSGSAIERFVARAIATAFHTDAFVFAARLRVVTGGKTIRSGFAALWLAATSFLFTHAR